VNLAMNRNLNKEVLLLGIIVLIVIIFKYGPYDGFDWVRGGFFFIYIYKIILTANCQSLITRRGMIYIVR